MVLGVLACQDPGHKKRAGKFGAEMAQSPVSVTVLAAMVDQPADFSGCPDLRNAATADWVTRRVRG